MKFDIVNFNESYRGIDRLLKSDALYSKESKGYYSKLISIYFEYLELMHAPSSDYTFETFNKLVNYYKSFLLRRVNCEVIAFDSAPLDSVFDKKVEFLGIDITHDLAESLLFDTNSLNSIVKRTLNHNGLLHDLNDLRTVLKLCDCGVNIDWTPCWVYRVIV